MAAAATMRGGGGKVSLGVAHGGVTKGGGGGGGGGWGVRAKAAVLLDGERSGEESESEAGELDPLEALAQLALDKLAAEDPQACSEEDVMQLGKLINDLAGGMDQVWPSVALGTGNRYTAMSKLRIGATEHGP
jgi:hypothetical protein